LKISCPPADVIVTLCESVASAFTKWIRNGASAGPASDAGAKLELRASSSSVTGVGVGGAVGFGVGLGVGFGVGLGVGFGVGLGVGLGLGPGVSLAVGLADGRTVGCAEGPVVAGGSVDVAGVGAAADDAVACGAGVNAGLIDGAELAAAEGVTGTDAASDPGRDWLAGGPPQATTKPAATTSILIRLDTI
jgi:hypothetical protein